MTNSIADLATNPPEITVSTKDYAPIAIDTAAQLANGHSSPLSVTCTLLVNNDSGDTITLANAPTVTGSVVYQIIDGSQLTAGYDYLLITRFDTGTGTLLAVYTSINVPI